MATSNYSLTNANGWVEVADLTDDFIIEVRDPEASIKVTMQTSAPATTAAYHIVSSKSPFIRAGTTGKAYISITEPVATSILVIVSI